jgi:hypothetical protein
LPAEGHRKVFALFTEVFHGTNDCPQASGAEPECLLCP